jgi:ATP-binding cassette subfamily F protein 3
LISIENLSKSYLNKQLFDKISFKVNPKEKLGLVGRNGHGKTTLIKIIVGEESPDEGTINIPKNYSIGYVKQHLKFKEKTILSEAVLSLKKEDKDQIWKVEKILFGLGFSKEDLQKSPLIFSGGFQVRLNLAKVLISEPDLLLLDEPTNYLDISSIRWMENFLKNWKKELILITHDRFFMDKVVTHILGIHRQKIIKIKGNTNKLYAQIEKEEEIYEKTRINEEQRRKEMELFISRFRAKARLANMVQSRIKTLEKMEKKSQLEKIKNLNFSFNYKPYSGKILLNASNIYFGYTEERLLIKDFNITIGNNEKICIIGKNGKGKTTLLRLLSGDLPPQRGSININKEVSIGIYEQTNIDSLNENLTVLEETVNYSEDLDTLTARNACAAMMFDGDDALKKISVLSGGEKSRVMLSKIIAKPCNLLFLDEPTNHLDMQSCDALLEAIKNFKGSVVMVTHNEMFLKTIAEKLIIFQNNKIELFEGGYDYFLEKIGWDEENDRQDSKRLSVHSKKLNRKKRAEIIKEKSKIINPLKEKINCIENEIEKCENEIKKLNAELIQLSEQGDYKKSLEINKQLEELNKKIEILFEDLEKYTTTYEEKEKYFESLINAEN